MEVTVVELFKVNVARSYGDGVLGKKIFVFTDHMEAYRWLITLPMDSSHIDYYFKSTKVELDNPELNIEQPFNDSMYANYEQLQGARRIKDLDLVMRGLAK